MLGRASQRQAGEEIVGAPTYPVWLLVATMNKRCMRLKDCGCDACDRSVTVIPRELKIHPSVLKLFSTSKPKSARKDKRDVGVLKVEFGLGTGHGMHGTDIWGAVSSWLEQYVVRDVWTYAV